MKRSENKLRQGKAGRLDHAAATLGASTADDRYMVSFCVRKLYNQNFVNSMQRESILTNAANPGSIAYFPAKDAERYVGLSLRSNF